MTLDRFAPISSEPVPSNARLFRAGGIALLVEPDRGVTELGESRVFHPLEGAWSHAGAVGDILLVSRGGVIYRFVPGAQPVRYWNARMAGSRVSPTGLDDDRMLVAHFGGFLNTVSLIARGERRWSRRGVPQVGLANGDLVVRWDHLKWHDTRPALSLVDPETGRDRWRVGMGQLMVGLAAHPAQAEEAKRVTKLRGASPAPALWGPDYVGAVAGRAWFTWGARDFGSLVFGLDLATGALAAATAIHTVAPKGDLLDTKLHLLTAGRYEIFDLERDGALVSTSHLKLPTYNAKVRCLLDDGRALLATGSGHLLLVDHRSPDATRVLLHRPDEYVDVPVVIGERLYVVHRPFGSEGSATLAILG